MTPWKERFRLSFDPDSTPESERRRMFAEETPLGKARMIILAHLMKAGRGWADEASDAFFWRLFNAAVADALFLRVEGSGDGLSRLRELAGAVGESIDAMGPAELLGLAQGNGSGAERLRQALSLHPAAPDFSAPLPDKASLASAFRESAFQACFELAKALIAYNEWAELSSEAERTLGACFDPVEISLGEGPKLSKALAAARECEALAAVAAGAAPSEQRKSL